MSTSTGSVNTAASALWMKRVSRQAVTQRAFRWLTLGVLVIATASAAVSVRAQPHGPGGPGGPGMMMFGGSPERIGRMADHFLDGLDASDAQRAQIKQIAQAAAADLRTQREAARGLRERAMAAFTAPNVDANALEAVRQQMLAQHDQASRRITQAMLDVSRVLSPEQRAKIAQRMQEREARMRERMQRWQRGAASAPR